MEENAKVIVSLKKVITEIIPSIINRTDNSIYEERLEICKSCPLFINNNGKMKCDPTKTILNVKTNKMVNGCGCNLNNKLGTKSLDPKLSCPAEKW